MTVSVAEDDDAIPEPAVTLTHKVTGADEYENPTGTLTISPVRVTAKENDEAGVTATPTSLTVAPGSSETYGIRLTSEPLGAITVTVNSPSDDVTVTGSPVVHYAGRLAKGAYCHGERGRDGRKGHGTVLHADAYGDRRHQLLQCRNSDRDR